MAIYSHSVRTTNVTINTAQYEIRAAATNRPSVMEIGIASSVATAMSLGFGRPSALGITPTQTSFQPDDPNGATALSSGATSWGTSPTAPAIYARRINTPATVGAGVIWTFPRGFEINASASVVIFNITAGVASDVWAVIDE